MHFSTSKQRNSPTFTTAYHWTDGINHLSVFITISATKSAFFFSVENEKSRKSVSPNCISFIVIHCLHKYHKRSLKSIRFDETTENYWNDFVSWFDTNFHSWWVFFLIDWCSFIQMGTIKTMNFLEQAYRILYIRRAHGVHMFFHPALRIGRQSSLFLAFVIFMRCIVRYAMCGRKYFIFNSMTRFLNCSKWHSMPHIFHRNSCRQASDNVEQRTMTKRRIFLLHREEWCRMVFVIIIVKAPMRIKIIVRSIK